MEPSSWSVLIFQPKGRLFKSEFVVGGLQSKTIFSGIYLSQHVSNLCLSSFSSVIKTTHRTWQKCQTSLTGASLLSKLVCPGGEERIEGVERSVTIIPNMGGQESRRRSIADYAFPELHPDTALRRSSRNLLIYTRTRCLEMGTCTLFQFWKRSDSEIFTFPKYFQFCQ